MPHLSRKREGSKEREAESEGERADSARLRKCRGHSVGEDRRSVGCARASESVVAEIVGRRRTQRSARSDTSPEVTASGDGSLVCNQ